MLLWTTNPQDEFISDGGQIYSVSPFFPLPAYSKSSWLSYASQCSFSCLARCSFSSSLVVNSCFTLYASPCKDLQKFGQKIGTDPEIIPKHGCLAGERWFFLNGCCVSGHNVQENVDVLAKTFGRPIFAIHNRTYGVLGDLFECILQRSFDLFTEETRVCYEYIKAYCADPDVKKVVMIAHSQGCIIAS
jgi:hypothetical protein